MSMKVIGYKGKYRIVSIALNESVRDDLLKNMLDTVYVTSESVTIYPENEILTTDKDIIQRLYDGNNYDEKYFNDVKRVLDLCKNILNEPLNDGEYLEFDIWY